MSSGTRGKSLFTSPFLPDDVISPPDLRLAAAVTPRIPEAPRRSRRASAAAERVRMHSQGPRFLPAGLHWAVEPAGLSKAVPALPAPRTVVQTHG